MTRYIKIPKPSPYFLFVLTLVAVLTVFGVVGYRVGTRAAESVEEAGAQETMTIMEIEGWCIRGNILSLEQWIQENEMRVMTKQDVMTALPQIQEYCSSSLAEFRGWLAEQKADDQ